MTAWEYKCVPVDRTGTKEDFGFSWTYGPWQLSGGQATKQSLNEGLQALGRDGWELAGVLPTDLWAEGTRTANASHGIRGIACTLLFKRPSSQRPVTERPVSEPPVSEQPVGEEPPDGPQEP